jgi:DNA polymerase-3 subunit delta'
VSFAPWQHDVYARLERSLREGRLAHALLFAGPARMGKAEVAQALAARLLCQAPRDDGLACGECRACHFLAAGTHPDFQHITFEPTEKGDKLRSELVVDQIRRLGEWFSKTPQFGGAQVVLVEPAEALNVAAANALLKTLEEPAGHRYLLLVTSRPGRLPATIRSRCQRLEFALPAREVARAWLVARGHKPEAADEALAAARGQPGLADAWLSQGGLALRAQVQAELDAVGRGKASPIETAQRWLADEHGEQRLRFAADLALDAAAQVLGGRGGLAPAGGAPGRGAAPQAPGGSTVHSSAGREVTFGVAMTKADVPALSTWFDALNVMRAQLPAPLRHDLILAGLLRDWRTMLATGSGPGQGGPSR